MGEYAIRKSDDVRVKIGTCEDMYYLRFEDRSKVRHDPGNVDPNKDSEAGHLRFRLPFPDEDHIRVGEYEDYCRSIPLRDYTPDEEPDAGRFQMHHKNGVLLSLPCYHGMKLPDVPKGWTAHWNGKNDSFALSSIRAVVVEGQLNLFPVIRCVWCDHAWRESWENVLPFVKDPVMVGRLMAYQNYKPEVQEYSCDFTTGLFSKTVH